MAKKKADKPTEESSEREPETTAKLPVEMLRRVNMVVFHRKKKDPSYTVGKYLRSILWPVVNRDYADLGREISEEDSP